MFISKKESAPQSNTDILLQQADELFEAGRWWGDEGNATAATRNFAQALTIFNNVYQDPHNNGVIQLPEFHRDFAHVYQSFAYYTENDSLYEKAMLHYETAAQLYEEVRDYDQIAHIRVLQSALLKTIGDYERAADYEGMVDRISQATTEIPIITEADLKEYDDAKRTEHSPRKLANSIINKFVNIVSISRP